MSNHTSIDIRAIEKKTRQDLKDADNARTAVQNVLLQKLVHENRNKLQKKDKKQQETLKKQS